MLILQPHKLIILLDMKTDSQNPVRASKKVFSTPPPSSSYHRDRTPFGLHCQDRMDASLCNISLTQNAFLPALALDVSTYAEEPLSFGSEPN